MGSQSKDFVAFSSPNRPIEDNQAIYWLRQITIRLRREICWCWYERGILPDSDNYNSEILPPYVDKPSIALNYIKFHDKKKKFFETDKTASYLTEQIQKDTLPTSLSITNNKNERVRGTFSWIVNELKLDDVASFILALGLLVVFDDAASSVISACLNDPRKTYPNFALARKIWDRPEQIMAFEEPLWQLFRLGLLQFNNNENIKNIYSETDNEIPIRVPILVAYHVLFPNSTLPHIFKDISYKDYIINEKSSLIASRLKSKDHDKLRIVPIRGNIQSDYMGMVCGISKLTNRKVVELTIENFSSLEDKGYLNSILTFCWMKDFDLFLGIDLISKLLSKNNSNSQDTFLFSLLSIPVNVFICINNLDQLKNIPHGFLLPIVDLPKLSYEERIQIWRKNLGEKSKGLDETILEISRRFRFEKKSIDNICKGLTNLDKITYTDIINACISETEIDFGDLAQKHTPMFEKENLILPVKQLLLFQEIVTAMRSLLKTNFGWNMAKSGIDTGITVLFAGNSGTGKTMAAEILARELELPMYKIDLSQVINKYIGETEKHLKKIFDIAEYSDIILFFDEADTLFGHRTEAKDSHDRFANLQVNYLLQRLVSFKGFSILATNRKKEFDEAFLRRIRYILEFPFPSEQQRKSIWKQVIPSSMDSSELDFDFLSKQFQLTGGNIRSIVLNACLQSAKTSSSKDKIKDVLTMEKIIIAIKREFEKSNRSLSIDQFGKYSEIINKIDSL